MATRSLPHPLVTALAASGFPAASDAVDDIRFAVAQSGTTTGFAELIDAARHRPGVRYTDRVQACQDLLAVTSGLPDAKSPDEVTGGAPSATAEAESSVADADHTPAQRDGVPA